MNYVQNMIFLNVVHMNQQDFKMSETSGSEKFTDTCLYHLNELNLRNGLPTIDINSAQHFTTYIIDIIAFVL